MTRRLPGLCVCLLLAGGLLAVCAGSSRADGKHGYFFGGWTGKIGYQYIRTEDEVDSVGEYQAHLAVSATLTLSADGVAKITLGWDETTESTDPHAACIGLDASEGTTYGTQTTRKTGKGGAQQATTLQVSHDAKEMSFQVPAVDVTYTEETTFPECPHFEPQSRTYTVNDVGGEVFHTATRLADPEVPKLKGSIAQTRSNSPGTIKEQWRGGYDLTSCGEYAGPRWPIHFQDDKRIEALNEPFQGNVRRFIAALKAAGATVTINTVYRPQPRAYLMHYSWRVGYGRQSASGRYTHIDPPDVPKYDGSEQVPICWKVPGLDGKYSRNLSIKAARDMVSSYHIVVAHGAAYPSNHSARTALDMGIKWHGDLKIRNGPQAPLADRGVVTISSLPHSGMNRQLWRIGRNYGVIKYVNAQSPDPPHWSANGR